MMWQMVNMQPLPSLRSPRAAAVTASGSRVAAAPRHHPAGRDSAGSPGGPTVRPARQPSRQCLGVRSYWYALRIWSITLGPHAIVPVSKTGFPSTARAYVGGAFETSVIVAP